MKLKLNIKQWLLLGLLLRLVLMPFALHPDMLYINRRPLLLSHGEWDVYGILARDFGQSYYPPLAMIFFAVTQFLFGFSLSPFEEFSHLLMNENPTPNLSNVLSYENLFLSFFLMKFPYLVFDGLLVWACWKILSNDEGRKFFTIFWVVNPVIIYGSYLVGQFDLIPSFFVVLACYFSLRRETGQYACLSLATGCLFKVFPIIFLPIVLCMTCRDMRDFVRLSLYGTVPIIVSYGLFYIFSGTAVLRLFVDLSHLGRVSGDFDFLVLRFLQASIYILVCGHILYFKKIKLNASIAVQYFLVVYLALYWGLLLSSTHYFIWVMPFIIMFLQQHQQWKKPFYVLLLIIFLGGLKSRVSAMGIFAPLNPEFFLSLPSLGDAVGFLFDSEKYYFVIEIIFKGLTGVMVLSILTSLFFYQNQRSG